MSMTGKLQDLKFLILLFIILKELHTPEASCSCSSSSSCNCNNRGLTYIPQNFRTSISSLSLINNRLTELAQSHLSRYWNLRYLDLEGNQISSIQAGTFSAAQLTTLFIHKNDLTSIPNNVFVNLPQLLYLYLYSNHITSIQSGAFSNLPQLQILRLDGNKIHTISPGSFRGLGNLQELQLQNNSLTAIPTAGYQFLELTDLYLNNNNITYIPDHAFSNQPKLSILHLHQNRISTLSERAFTLLAQLNKLYLYDNILEEIPDHLFVGMSNLYDLRLQNNNISQVFLHSFTGISSLSYFNLSNNGLQSFPVEALSMIPTIYRLYIQNNHMQVLSIIAYDKLASISYTVSIENNPWQCDCRMVPFRLKMGGRSFENQITCQGPSSFLGQKLKDINPKNLICEEPRIVRFDMSNNKPLEQGGTLHLVCEASGIPTPDIAVILPSGRHVTQSGGRVTMGENGNIIITNITAADAGVYNCIAASPVGGYKLAGLAVSITMAIETSPLATMATETSPLATMATETSPLAVTSTVTTNNPESTSYHKSETSPLAVTVTTSPLTTIPTDTSPMPVTVTANTPESSSYLKSAGPTFLPIINSSPHKTTEHPESVSTFSHADVIGAVLGTAACCVIGIIIFIIWYKRRTMAIYHNPPTVSEPAPSSENDYEVPESISLNPSMSTASFQTASTSSNSATYASIPDSGNSRDYTPQ